MFIDLSFDHYKNLEYLCFIIWLSSMVSHIIALAAGILDCTIAWGNIDWHQFIKTIERSPEKYVQCLLM